MNSVIKSLIVFSILFLTLLVKTCAQELNNLDIINGFKEFKFGDTSEKFKAKYKSNMIETFENLPKGNSKYTIIFDKNSLEEIGIEFTGVTVYFVSNKLYKINFVKMYKLDEYMALRSELVSKSLKTDDELLLNELIGTFGQKFIKGSSKNPLEFNWTTNKNECVYHLETNEQYNGLFLGVTFSNLQLLNIAIANKYK